MTMKEILQSLNITTGLFNDDIYLSIVKSKSDDIVEIKEARKLTEEEIRKTIFFLSKAYLEKNKNTTTDLESSTQIITISIKNKEELWH